MKKFREWLHPFIQSILLFIMCGAYSQESLFSSTLPIVIIDTQNQVIVDEPRITCNMGIIYNTNEINYLTDLYNNYNGKISIEIRGESSQEFPKKSYSLETQDEFGENNNVSLLTMPTENDWVLYGPYYDITMIRNGVTYEIAKSMGQYSPRFRYCELFINDEYQGIYLLTEKIKRDNNRVNISKNTNDDVSGGFIIEINHPVSEDKNINEYWISSYNDFNNEIIPFRYYYPDVNSITESQKIYIQNFIYEFETILSGSMFNNSFTGFKNWINTNSAIQFFLIQEFSKNIDAYRGSTYFYKDKSNINDTIFFGPIWDFNFAYGSTMFCEGDQYQGWQYETTCSEQGSLFWFKRFLDDPEYINSLNCQWNNLRNNILSDDSIFYLIDSLSNHLDGAIIRDLDKWHNISTIEYEFEVLELKNWITNRLEWLDANMPGDCEINISEYINSKSVIKITDLLGRDTNQKGFNIEIYDDGSVEKKYVIE